MKHLIKKFLPPILLDVLKSIQTSSYGWKGNYKSWEDAQNQAIGYDSDRILEKVRNALLKVKNGKAVYERDSVVFDEIQYSWPLLAGLMLAAAKNNGKLSVLDFGGSLGSTYYQNKKFLNQLDSVSWNIVEQNNFVKCGKKEFEDERLHFYSTIEDCKKEQTPNVLVLSSVLQYIEKPYKVLTELLQCEFEFIIIDRTPVKLIKENIITLQIVPPSIYNASYPCWIFNKTELMDFFNNNNYLLIESFISNDGVIDRCSFEGFIFRKFHVA